MLVSVIGVVTIVTVVVVVAVVAVVVEDGVVPPDSLSKAFIVNIFSWMVSKLSMISSNSAALLAGQRKTRLKYPPSVPQTFILR